MPDFNTALQNTLATLSNMGFALAVPLINGGELSIPLKRGETLFLLGSNGSGKSSLLARWLSQMPASSRIAANREIFFSNAEIYAERKTRYDENRERFHTEIARWSKNPGVYGNDTDSRRDYTLTQLINAYEERNQQIAEADDANKARSSIPSPFGQINNLLQQAQLKIHIGLSKTRNLIVRRTNKKNNEEYSFAEASDGERAAVLIAAEVLLAERNRLFLIDEPERHLHRSISAPLLQALFAARPDCAFVISTHDLALARAIENAQILLLRNCAYKGGTPEKWDADLISDAADIPEAIQTAILGARRKILLVEGTNNSPDVKLYTILFPDYEAIAQGSCNGIIDAVKSAQQMTGLHWLRVFGIIDNDGRSEEEQAKLLADGIYTLPVYAIESLYFCPEILACIAQRKAETADEEKKSLENARQALIAAVSRHISKTARDRLARELRREIKAPTADDLKEPANYAASLAIITADSLKRRLAAADDELNKLIAEGDIAALISQFNLKCAQNAIADVFGFKREAYFREVRQYLRENVPLIELLRGKYFAPLSAKMDAAATAQPLS